jgi:hypothetical protein
MHENVPGNVGVLDEGIRVVIALAILASMPFMIRLDANSAIILVLAGLPTVAYLLLSSFAHVDPLYMMAGIDTRHHHHR